jgi:L-ascorbate metabolism protein UlaG (beta-lactamase superfamily)
MSLRLWIKIALGTTAAALIVRGIRRNRSRKAFVLDLPSGASPNPSEEGSIFFVGTATTLIRHAGFTILTDPNFLHRGQEVHLGYGLHSTRLTEPALDLDQLPPIDFVLLSHLHEDHFDRLVAARLNKLTPIITTVSAAGSLSRKGFLHTYGLETWDHVQVRKGDSQLKITAMPGTHGPLLVSSLLPSVIGSMLEFSPPPPARPYRLYITGDTLIHNQLREIPRRYPDIDLALLHLGGTRVFGILVTMDAAQGVQAIRIVGPRMAIPIHYNDYTVFKSPLDDFVRAVNKANLSDRVTYLNHGESYRFAESAAGQPYVGLSREG